MKRLSKIQFQILFMAIVLCPMMVMLLLWQGDFWSHRQNILFYLAFAATEILIRLVLLIFMKINADTELQNRNSQLIDAFYIAAIGFVCLYSVYATDENDVMKMCFAGMSLLLMYKGNRQSLSQANGAFAAMMAEYGERTHKKSKRISARFLFGTGLFGFLLFLLTPSIYFMFALGVFVVVFYIASFMTIYKSVRAIDE